MRFTLIIGLTLTASLLFAQKKTIDTTAYTNWQSLSAPILSNDGMFVIYDIKNMPVGRYTTVLQATNGKWKKEYVGGLKSPRFSSNGKYLLFIAGGDSLAIFNLNTNRVKYVSNVETYNLIGSGDAEVLSYHPVDKSNTLILVNIVSKLESLYKNVQKEQYSEDGTVLIVYQKDEYNPGMEIIKWIDTKSGKVSDVWGGNKSENLIIDSEKHQLAFTIGDSLLYYKLGFKKAMCITETISTTIGEGLTFGGLNRFSRDGSHLFITLKERDKAKPINKDVEVWSYRDLILQTEQESDLASQTFLASYELRSQKIIQMQEDVFETLEFPSLEACDSIVLVKRDFLRDKEPWIPSKKMTYSLLFIKAGSKRRLDFLDNNLTVRISSEGKYLIYYDFKIEDYFSYEIATDSIRNLTKGINVSWKDIYHEDQHKNAFPRQYRNLLWSRNDESVMVYDRYDIWKLDPLNRHDPINVTNGYGRKHQIVFNLMTEGIKALTKDTKLYLTAFNQTNKNNGFFLKQLNKGGDPELLTMESSLFDTNSNYVHFGSNFTPVKAKNAACYVVRRMSATEAPNYFCTKDFKTFIRITDIQPQKLYNWYTTELHSWESFDGKILQGILYKPENFDPSKKYPIIFNYYERKSDGLNAFITPEPLCSGCEIDIPTYVSNGYLVFTPDIYYKIGNPMQGTYDAVVSAANYLSSLTFVNSKKMGIQGCSHGALQTNYLVTHTNLFTAACSASGASDLVSKYGSLNHGGSYFENGQGRMGKSLWENPNTYIKSSPIFQLDKVTTPILIMHTKKDSAVPYSQAIELFTGLRRLGKKGWMLVYSEGNHGLDGKEAEDFSIRMMQFFDHYLKGKPAPIWMVDGVLAKDRSWKAGLELDKTGRLPGSGLLTQKEQDKVDSMMTRKPINIILK
jgi:dipeptidyl aminopeptidase/acylaminoacyl peptidase